MCLTLYNWKYKPFDCDEKIVAVLEFAKTSINIIYCELLKTLFWLQISANIFHLMWKVDFFFDLELEKLF